jgi:hypothetical protein
LALRSVSAAIFLQCSSIHSCECTKFSTPALSICADPAAEAPALLAPGGVVAPTVPAVAYAGGVRRCACVAALLGVTLDGKARGLVAGTAEEVVRASLAAARGGPTWGKKNQIKNNETADGSQWVRNEKKSADDAVDEKEAVGRRRRAQETPRQEHLRCGRALGGEALKE